MSDETADRFTPLPAKPAWEVDFPLERVEAQHVTRREFAKFLVLTSGGLAAGSGWVATRDALFPPAHLPGPVRIASLAEVPVGGMLSFTIPGVGEPGILIRLEEGLRAFEQKCTHLSCAVLFDPGSGRIECPCHAGAFDPRTGQVLQGPPPRPLRSYPVEVRGDEVWLVPARS